VTCETWHKVGYFLIFFTIVIQKGHAIHFYGLFYLFFKCHVLAIIYFFLLFSFFLLFLQEIILFKFQSNKLFW